MAMEKIGEDARVPELHGGPEGQYLREATGRWRSVSQEARRGPPPQVAPPTELPAEKAARDVRQETGKLWEAARRRMDPQIFEAIKRQDDLDRAEAEVLFEKARHQATWDLLRRTVTDRQLLSEIARLASGGEGRCLSVEKARRLFDAPTDAADVARPTGIRRSFSRGEDKRPSRPPRPLPPRNGSRGALGGA